MTPKCGLLARLDSGHTVLYYLSWKDIAINIFDCLIHYGTVHMQQYK